MLKTILFLCFLVYMPTSFACAPAMHAYLGKMWLDSHHVTDEVAQREFILGTLFPDIRYLGRVDRAQTHAKNVTLAAIDKAPDYFKKGMLFHAYVDEQHEAFMNKSKAYQNLPKDITVSKVLFIELIEDEMIYDPKWNQTVSNYLTGILPSEKILGLSSFDIYQWHFILSLYFSKAPSENLNDLAMLHADALFLKAKTVKTWRDRLPEMKKKPYYKQYVASLIALFKAKLPA